VVDDISAAPVAEGLVARLRAAGCVFAEDEAALLLAAAADVAELDRLTERRTAGVPLEHVLGWAEFCGQRILVEDGVFVPRHRTELLVELAVELARDASPGRAATVLVDLCCGSGALGAVVASRLRPAGLELHAADIDTAAVRCARRNLASYGGRVHEGDLYAALPPALRGRVDILLANAPYVPTDAVAFLPPEAREHESLVALDGGSDGLSVLLRVIAEAADWIAPDGHLFLESSAEQATKLVSAALCTGLDARAEASEDVTVVVATRPSRH
jgi:release factor glutamine methyltransferase